MNRINRILLAMIFAASTAAVAQNNAPPAVHYDSRFDLAGGFNLIDANAPPGSCECFTMNGAFVEGDYNFRKWLGVAGMVTAGHAKDISDLGQNLTLTTFAGGPRVRWDLSRLTLFGEFFAGEARGTGSYFPTSTGSKSSASGLALSTGGGVDLNITPRFAIRAINAQFLHTGLPNGTNDSQHQLQISTGVVFRFGGHHMEAAPPMRVPDRRSEIEFNCSVSAHEVAPGDPVQIIGETMTLPDKLDVTYSWSSSDVTGVQGNGRTIDIDSSHLAPGTYHVDGRASLVSDPSESATCQTTFHVSEGSANHNSSMSSQTIETPAGDMEEFRKHVVDFFFSYDSSTLRVEAADGIVKDAAYLNANPDINITIAGYADERGSAEYNIALGLKRAEATRIALEKAGVSSSRIQVLSYGKEKSFCSDDTPACMQSNRRAQILKTEQ